MPQLTKMFTIVSPDDEDGDGHCDLLFYRNTGESYTEEDMYAIIRDPTCLKLMGGSGILAPKGGGPEELLLFTNDIDSHAIDQMDNAPPGKILMVCSPSGGIETVNFNTEYYNCKLPHRTIVGCVGCLNRKTKANCRIKEIGLMVAGGDSIALTPYDVINDKHLLSRKSTIADFTYVSPRLTALENFAKTYRPVEEHNFEMVEERSASVRQGVLERKRRRKFNNTVCPTCLVHKSCKKVCTEKQEKYCIGPYTYTEEEALQEVLQRVKIPFTNYQLLYLAYNSGELSRRYLRRRYWATFRVERGTLRFGICRYTTGAFTALKDFKEAKELLCKYNKQEFTLRKGFKYFTQQQKAVLIMLGQQHCSPTRVSRWHLTQYDALGIVYDPINSEFSLHFKYNNPHSEIHYQLEGKTHTTYCGLKLPWTIDAKNFNDIFKECTELPYIFKTDHPDSYWNTRQSPAKYRY